MKLASLIVIFGLTRAIQGYLRCGVPSRGQIYKGKEVSSRYKYPWLVNIRYRDGRKSNLGHNVLCGGVAISEDLVLTAAHCLVEARQQQQKVVNPQDLYVYYWSYNVSNEDDPNDLRGPVRKIYVHPYYGMATNSFDIAIIQTSFRIHHVMPICLPCDAGIHRPFEPRRNDTCIAVGWGLTEQLQASQVPLEARLPIIRKRHCRSKWGNAADASMLCAGKGNYKRPVTCLGDSGGPLMCIRHGRWFVSGITSWGAINCWQKPAVFNNVVKMRNWISIMLHHLDQEKFCPNDHLQPRPLSAPPKKNKKVDLPCDATLFQWEKQVYMVANFTTKDYSLKNISHGWECSRRCCENKHCKSVLYYPKYKECYQFVNRLCELPPDKINRNYKEDDVIYYGKAGCHKSINA